MMELGIAFAFLGLYVLLCLMVFSTKVTKTTAEVLFCIAAALAFSGVGLLIAESFS